MHHQTAWATKHNPYTGKVQMKEVAVPQTATQRKGHTKYDEAFEKLLEFKSGIESNEQGFETLRRALMRFVEFRGLQSTVRIRRQLDRNTRQVILWLEKKEQK